MAQGTLSDPYVLLGGQIAYRVNSRGSDSVGECGRLNGITMPRVTRYLRFRGTNPEDGHEQWYTLNSTRAPNTIITLEKVSSVPKIVRKELIRAYISPASSEARAYALASARYTSFTCHVYLRCSSTEVELTKLNKSRKDLRDFPLYLDDLGKLGMDAKAIARDMAMGLAAGHWCARVNMLGVKYLLGGLCYEEEAYRMSFMDPETKLLKDLFGKPAIRSKGSIRERRAEEQRRSCSLRRSFMQLWMTDFEKTEKIDCSADPACYHENIRTLVAQTLSMNGLYCPRALARNSWEWDLWVEFAETYIIASRAIIHDATRESTYLGYITTDPGSRVIKRPAVLINEWIRLEAEKEGIDYEGFVKMVKQKGWRLPSTKHSLYVSYSGV